MVIGKASTASPVKLSKPARVEYKRLLGVLQTFGSLEVIDLMCVANAARTKALLDAAYKDLGGELDRLKINTVNKLTTQHRGLMRELGLTTSPNRASFRPKATGTVRDGENSWDGILKVS